MLWEYISGCMKEHEEQIIYSRLEKRTYGQILKEAEQLSTVLCCQKYGILCKSTIHTMIAILACICSGKTAVPLSVRYGKNHYERLIQQFQVGSLITDTKGSIQLATIGEKKEIVEEELKDVCFLLSSSGTTGNPKGVMLTRENILSNLLGSEQIYKLSKKDRVLIVREMYHCSAIMGDFLMSILRGASICIMEEGFLPLPALTVLEQEKITMLAGTPTMFTYLALMQKKRQKDLCLRYASIGGEVMTKSQWIKIREEFSCTEFIHSYGLTETCSRATFAQMKNLTDCTCVGNMMNHMYVKITDKEGNVLEPFSQGQIWLKGDCVMKGYYNSEEENRKVWTNSWFYTGDMGYLDEKGRLYVLGRQDSMFIRGGINIYPAEIENIVQGFHEIRETLVSGSRKGSERMMICMKCVLEDGVYMTKRELIEKCIQHLPAYMLPDRVEIVDEIGKSTGGKRKESVEA